VFILHCTKKLLDRLGPATGEADQVTSTTRLGDWTANRFFIGRQQLVLAVNNTTLLPVLLPIAPNKTFFPRFTEAAGEMLMALGIDRKEALSEMSAMSECIVAPTNSRQVLGIINDFGKVIGWYLEGGTLPEAALHLAETPCGPLKMESPRKATLARFEELGSRAYKPALRLVKG
jgi:hypothetical protein